MTQAFGYDAINQVTADNGTTLTYDATGNRTMTGYVTSEVGHRLESVGDWQYLYDAEGQLTKKVDGSTGEQWLYSYDHRGQVVSAVHRNGAFVTLATVEYFYDAFGNRIRRVEKDGSDAVVSDERFAVDGWDTAKGGAVGTENFDTWADLDASNIVTMRRVYGTGFDEPLARVPSGGATGWYLTDRQGSVRRLVDGSGTTLGSRDFSAFGAITATSGAGLDRYAYTAREWDDTLALQYTRMRMYDPAVGRFLREDQLGLAAGDVNPFRYVGNAVTMASDPSGLFENREAPKNWDDWFLRFGQRVVRRVEGPVAAFRHGWDETMWAFPHGLRTLSSADGWQFAYDFYSQHGRTFVDELGDRVVRWACESAKNAETLYHAFWKGLDTLSTAEGWKFAWDFYTTNGQKLFELVWNNSPELAADLALEYLSERGPAVVDDLVDMSRASKLARGRGMAPGDLIRFRSTYQGGPYPAGRFGRGGTLWDADAAYRSGQVRAERLIHEAGRRLGVDVRTLADEIVYIPGADAPFFTVQNGRRILALNERAVTGADESLRLLKAAHEVGHARVHNNPAAFGGPLTYEAEEVLVESAARNALAPDLLRRALRNSVIYENAWRAAQGLPPLPVPP